jgi:tRNA-specific 2-thiouridylase
MAPCARDYAAGRTRNPGARCNQHVKFGPLLARARALGAERLATGHYARLDGGRLRRARDAAKDQSYFLFAMGSHALASTLFPLGEWTKADVRAKAAALGLPNADAPDSQELCFVPTGDHGAMVEERLAALGVATDALAPGPVVDEQGTLLGEHDGIHRVTIGQRRGLRIPGPERRYVLAVVPERRTVVVGPAEHTTCTRIEVGELHRLGLAAAHRDVFVQLRHRAAAVPAIVATTDTTATLELAMPTGAVAPGQAAVIYGADDEVLAGGWITRAS